MRSEAVRVFKAKSPLRQTCLCLAGCLFIACTASGKDIAPPSPDKPWAPAQLNQYETALTNQDLYTNSNMAAVAIETNTTYDLPALIDIAERSNPETRIAWEKARAAAQSVGLAQSAYYPYLAASAAAGFDHQLSVLSSVFPGNIEAEDVSLDVKWLLFDFGARKATTTEAREQLMMANVSFNATHQLIVFKVTQNFYQYITARQRVTVSESLLTTANKVEAAAQARFDQGLGTKPNVLQAQQQTAQAIYDLEAARGDLSDALVALVESIGILPTTDLQIADVSDKIFTGANDESLDELMDRALAQRPDLVAKLANVRAQQAAVKAARAAYYPKISAEANVGWERLEVNAYDSPYIGNSKPDYGLGIGIELPLFDGFARAKKLHVAEANLRAAQAELVDGRDTVVREVWKASTDFKTALRKQESAAKFLDAAQSAFDASLESYKQGLGNYVDVSTAQHNLTTARSVVIDTHSAIFTSAAALALSVGDLAKPVTHQ